MADGITIPATGSGTATPVVATDDISSVHYQRVKLTLGGDGTNSGDLASGAGSVSALTPRVTLASDDPAVALLGTIDADTGAISTAASAIQTAIQIMDDWDETDRAKVNIIAGQAGITAGAGAVSALTPRVTLASDDPAVAHLANIVTAVQIIDNFISGSRGLVTEDNSAAIAASLSVVDDWDETDRAKVNIIAGQAGITAGAGAVSALTPRVTMASDSPDVTHLATIAGDTTAIETAVQIMDDWDESDRAKVNIIAGQAGITAGAGSVSALTPRVTLASDDPAVAHLANIVTSVQLLDDAIIADDAAFTPATTKVLMAGFEYDDTSPDSVNEGDGGAARMSANRNVYMQIRDAAGNERGVNVDFQGRANVAVAQDVVTVSGNVALAPQRQPINVNSSGQILVSGVANRKIRVLNGVLMAPTAVTINLKSANNSDLSGPMPLGATGGFQIPHAELGNFETLAGQNLTVSMSTGVQVGGWLTYVLV